jgi:hypothetical protein
VRWRPRPGDPYLVAQELGLALDVDYTNAVRLTMAVVSLAPLAVGLLVFFPLPRPPRRRGRVTAGKSGRTP